MHSRKFLRSFLLCGCCFLSNAGASTVFTDGVQVNPFGTLPNGNAYQIAADVDPPDSNSSVILLVVVDSGLTLTSFSASAGIGGNWYGVTEGEVVGPDLVASGTLLGGLIGGANIGGQLQLQAGQSFLVGFWLDSNPPILPGIPGDGIPGNGDRFGWARLSYTPAGGLVLLDSAISVSDGIIAGTTTTVPESGTTLIAALSCGLALRRRRI